MQKFRVRPVDPALEDSRGKASANSAGARHLVRVELQQAPGEIRNTKWGEEPGGMKASSMELSRRDAADAAGDLVADSDGGQHITAGHPARFRQSQRRGFH